jgi:hypothetical protein
VRSIAVVTIVFIILNCALAAASSRKFLMYGLLAVISLLAFFFANARLLRLQKTNGKE